jgi:phage terminase large subunit-like protein
MRRPVPGQWNFPQHLALGIFPADAIVWAMTELMLGPARAEPRVRRL